MQAMHKRGRRKPRPPRKVKLHKGNEGKSNLTIREDKIVVWRRITRALKDIYDNNKDFVSKDNLETSTVDCESTPNPEGQGEALPAFDRETCTRSREGLVTQAVVANSARDMSVGAVIRDHPP